MFLQISFYVNSIVYFQWKILDKLRKRQVRSYYLLVGFSLWEAVCITFICPCVRVKFWNSLFGSFVDKNVRSLHKRKLTEIDTDLFLTLLCFRAKTIGLNLNYSSAFFPMKHVTFASVCIKLKILWYDIFSSMWCS